MIIPSTLKMDKSQSEVTDKIRNSIKEKLKEMNTFVDDELPDYIMILIANKRSKHHMEKDLSLFLGNQTVEFTNWLWDLVNAFKGGPKVKSTKINILSNSQVENFPIKEIRAEEDDVLNYDPAEQGETLCLEEINETSNNEKIIVTAPEKVNNPKIPCTSYNELPANSHIVLEASEKQRLKPIIKQEKSDIDQVDVLKTKEPSQQKSAKVYPMQRIKQSPNNVFNKQKIAAKSSELSKPEYSGVASVVCFTQKKFGGAAAALQANKLLLKAVNDATKSVLSGRDVNDYYKPTPIKELSENKKNQEEMNDNTHTKKHFIKDLVIEQDNRVVEYEIDEPMIENAEQITPRHIVSLNPAMTFENRNTVYNSVSQPEMKTEEESSASPHFIVTLDGVDFNSLKRKRSIIADEPMDIDEDEEDFDDEIAEQTQEKKQKVAERCKYWPACKNNTNCAYHHPTVPCKSFPNCKFGDKCLYIHPNCKFDALCSKKDCPFTHCSVRKYPIVPTAVIKPMKIQKSKIVCKYYPRCTAKPCPFIHPKLCKFGTQCRSPKCPFGHFQIPNRDQLKWKAT